MNVHSNVNSSGPDWPSERMNEVQSACSYSRGGRTKGQIEYLGMRQWDSRLSPPLIQQPLELRVGSILEPVVEVDDYAE